MCLSVIAFYFITCTNKDEDPTNNTQTIEGSIWEGSNYGTLISLSFEKGGIAKFTKTGKNEDVTIYKYKYMYPNVTFEPTEDWAVTLYGKIDGDCITVINPTITQENQVIYTLYKIK